MKILDMALENKQKLGGAIKIKGLFKNLNEQLLNFVFKRAQVVQYEPKELLCSIDTPADQISILLRGSASIWLPGANESQVSIAQLGPLDAIGEKELMMNGSFVVNISAQTNLVTLCISKNDFFQLLENNPVFNKEMFRALYDRIALQDPYMIPLMPEDVSFDKNAVSLLPLPLMQRHRIMPFRHTPQNIDMGFVDAFSPALLRRIQDLFPSKEINPYKMSTQHFLEGIDLIDEHPAVHNATIPPNDDNPLPALLQRVMNEGASDLHLTAHLKPRWRVDGVIKEINFPSPLASEDALEWTKMYMSTQHIEEFELHSDVDLAISLGKEARFRVNIFRDHLGVGAVFRLVPSKILTFDQLGLPQIVGEFAQLPKGLVLFTGPTGSGKSTSLAAIIDLINRTQSKHIVTLEDPIEYVHESKRSLINQREIGTHTHSFAKALRAALRQDPDIVLVGELRDLETIQLALEVANTGHLVFGTLHTATAMSTIDRLVDIFPAGQQNQVRTSLSEVLRGIVSQTLCKKRGGGRVAALEILVATPAISNLMREGKSSQMVSIMQTGKREGHRLLNDSLLQLLQKGLIDYQEAYNKSIDKDDLSKRRNRIRL